jgi:hypothetical protein
MPQAVRPAPPRSENGRLHTRAANEHVRSAPTTHEPSGPDYAARDASEIAAHFPVPSIEVAARLVELLLPRGNPSG